MGKGAIEEDMVKLNFNVRDENKVSKEKYSHQEILQYVSTAVDKHHYNSSIEYLM